MNLSYPLFRLMVTGQPNTPNRPFPGMLADFITVHMTGNRSAGADAAAHAQWMKTNAPYSWHVTVDDIEAWQSIEWVMQGWHAGDGAGEGNRESIGLEICMHAGIDQVEAYEKAAELVAELLILGHGAKGVVQHNFWTGKDCPELIRHEPGRWEWFLDRVFYYKKLKTEPPEEDMTPSEVQRMIDDTIAAHLRNSTLIDSGQVPELVAQLVGAIPSTYTSPRDVEIQELIRGVIAADGAHDHPIGPSRPL